MSGRIMFSSYSSHVENAVLGIETTWPHDVMTICGVSLSLGSLSNIMAVNSSYDNLSADIIFHNMCIVIPLPNHLQVTFLYV